MKEKALHATKSLTWDGISFNKSGDKLFLKAWKKDEIFCVKKKVFLFSAVLGLRCCAGFYPGCDEQGLLSVVASHCGGRSYCQARALEHVGFSSRGSRLQRTGSEVVTHGLSCSEACGIFLDQGLNPCLLPWQASSSPLRHRGSAGWNNLDSWPSPSAFHSERVKPACKLRLSAGGPCCTAKVCFSRQLSPFPGGTVSRLQWRCLDPQQEPDVL